MLKAVEGEAMRSTGYSPFLCFDVADMDSTVVRLLQMGAALDGPIKYPAYGKVRERARIDWPPTCPRPRLTIQ